MVKTSQLSEHPIILIEAPLGFGKTFLLAQWRREFQAEGAVVAWLSARQIDEPDRFIQSLALAFRLGAGKPQFGQALLNAPVQEGIEGVTGWLAEISQTALNSILMIDQAHSLPPTSREALAYLLRNLPPNLRVIVASRYNCRLGIDDLNAYGHCVKLGTASLQFRIDETIQLVQSYFDSGTGHDAAAKLHELTEGWPLGLQLALSSVDRSGDPRSEVAALAARGGTAHDRLLSLLLDDIEPHDVAFLTRISIVDDLHPDLCRSIIQSGDEFQRLARICSTTPVLVAGENTEWFRMHALARQELRRRFEMLPAHEQRALHSSASAWFADHGMTEAAAHHALASGQNERAYELAEQSLYKSLMHGGRQTAVQSWLTRLTPSELNRRPRLVLAAAWSLALSARHDEAGNLVSGLLEREDIDADLRCECAMILSGGAIFADDPDRFAELHDPWADGVKLRDPILLHIHANRAAFRALLSGDAALARLRLNEIPDCDIGPTHRYLSAWSDFIAGLSYLWDGQVRRVEEVLRPVLYRVEGELGRRAPFASMIAGLLAAASWERDRPCDAAALMANRLDVLERNGIPEAVLLGYRTMGRIAWSLGAEDRALELLDALHAVGIARRLPRLCVASLAEQVRLNSYHFRADTCFSLCARINALLADPQTPQGPLWRRNATLLAETALSFARIAAQDWQGALEPLTKAQTAAQTLRLGRLRIELMGLRAFVLSRIGQDSSDLLSEARGLARSLGLQRVFDDAHPALGEWVRQFRDGGEKCPDVRSPAPSQAEIADLTAIRVRAVPSIALTPKEREVLELLANNLSNKEIGLAMEVTEQTVKWHVKNLLSKLNASSRKQAVQRAHILGFLSTNA